MKLDSTLYRTKARLVEAVTYTGDETDDGGEALKALCRVLGTNNVVEKTSNPPMLCVGVRLAPVGSIIVRTEAGELLILHPADFVALFVVASAASAALKSN